MESALVQERSLAFGPLGSDALERDDLAVQVRFYWGDALLQVAQPAALQPVYVGSTERSLFKLDEERLGAPEHALIVVQNGRFALHVGEDMTAELERDGKRRPLDAGICRLRPTDRATVTLGGIRAEIAFRPRPAPATAGPLESLDYSFFNLNLVLLALAGVFAMTATTRERADIVADELSSSTTAFLARFVRPTPPPPASTKPAADTSEVPALAPHRGEAGEAGRPDAPKVVRSRVQRGVKIDGADLASSSGLLSALRGAASAAPVFGANGIAGELKESAGKLVTAAAGDSFGFGGLGPRGHGPGGGGWASTIGINGITTHGRRDGYGSAPGLPRDGKSSQDPQIQESTTEQISGSLDKDLIRQVIRSNIGQVRYCYEDQLVTQHDLAGKLVVRFVIAGNGRVVRSEVAPGSTVRNAALGNCVLRRVDAWNFPSPRGGGQVVVTYPFVFTLAGE